MKKLLIALAIMSLCAVPAYAASANGSVNMSADISSQLTLDVAVFDGDPWASPVGAMDFGTLTGSGIGQPLSGSGHFTAVLTPNTSSRPYTVSQQATALSNGGATLPAGACLMTPWPVDAYGAAYPAGVTVDSSTQSFATGSSVTFYTSEAAGSLVSIPVAYAVNSEDPNATAAIPSDQPGGSYTTTVSFTVTLT